MVMDIVKYKDLIWVANFIPALITGTDVDCYSLHTFIGMPNLRVISDDTIEVIESNISYAESVRIRNLHMSELHHRFISDHVKPEDLNGVEDFGAAEMVDIFKRPILLSKHKALHGVEDVKSKRDVLSEIHVLLDKAMKLLDDKI